jgi:hypothetical protein
LANVAHKNLTGADLHEPKGADAAAANKVYVSNGAGSGTWQKLTASQLETTGPYSRLGYFRNCFTDVDVFDLEYSSFSDDIDE